MEGFEYDDIVKNLNKLIENEPEFFTPECMSKITAEDVSSKIFSLETEGSIKTWTVLMSNF